MSRGALVIATSLIVAVVQPAASQGVFFSGDQYGEVNLTIPQSAVSIARTIETNANYEKLLRYNSDGRLRRLSRPVGRLDIKLSTDKTDTCTASVISPDFIVTNYHCIPRSDGNDRVLEASILMGYYDEMSPETTERFSVDPIPVEADRAMDYAILRVSGNPAEKWGSLTLSGTDPRPAAELLVIHHPQGLPKRITRGRCQAGQPRVTLGTDLFHTCDTQGGSSGAPVYASETGEVLAIHRANATAEFNSAVRVASLVEKSEIIRDLATAADPPKDQVPSVASSDVETSKPIGASDEMVFWRSILESTDPEDFADFLERFPESVFADVAARRLQKLRAAPAATVASLPAEDPVAVTRPRTAERELGRHEDLTAVVPTDFSCNEKAIVTVRAPEASAFSGDREKLQRLLGGLRIILDFECPGLAELVIIGETGGREVFRGHAEQSANWTLAEDG